MTLTKETGTADPASNSYVTVAEADDYFSRHPIAAVWATKAPSDKETALITAGRTLDYGAAWKGTMVNLDQGMLWPRAGVQAEGRDYPSTSIPRQVQYAQFEVAALFLSGNRLADQDREGIKSVNLGDGAVQVEFDAASAPTMLGRAAPDLIRLYAIGTGQKGGMVSVYRM